MLASFVDRETLSRCLAAIRVSRRFFFAAVTEWLRRASHVVALFHGAPPPVKQGSSD